MALMAREPGFTIRGITSQKEKKRKSRMKTSSKNIAIIII